MQFQQSFVYIWNEFFSLFTYVKFLKVSEKYNYILINFQQINK